MTGPVMTIDSEIIKAWGNSRSTAKRIAADLAIKIRAGKIERYHDLPSSDDLAAKWMVSPGTALRAKQLLAEQELVKVEGGRYIVA